MYFIFAGASESRSSALSTTSSLPSTVNSLTTDTTNQNTPHFDIDQSDCISTTTNQLQYVLSSPTSFDISSFSQLFDLDPTFEMNLQNEHGVSLLHHAAWNGHSGNNYVTFLFSYDDYFS